MDFSFLFTYWAQNRPQFDQSADPIGSSLTISIFRTVEILGMKAASQMARSAASVEDGAGVGAWSWFSK
jgi:hypothetical protein